jgi:hypothetical protein
MDGGIPKSEENKTKDSSQVAEEEVYEMFLKQDCHDLCHLFLYVLVYFIKIN